jgi:S-adenosylmethionine decarboxylase
MATNQKSYPLISNGTHIIIDVSEIINNESLKYLNTVTLILDKIVEKFSLNVVTKALHQFQPFGVTGVYVLSESHLSIHTFVEEQKVAIDLYTCNSFNIKENINISDFIKSLFDDNCNVKYSIINR